MRLIDADRLSEIIRGNVSAPYEDSREAKEECLRIIEDALTIDAVPVTRCKDCKFSREPNQDERYISREALICTDSEFIDCGWNPVWPDDFCRYGERNDNE